MGVLGDATGEEKAIIDEVLAKEYELVGDEDLEADHIAAIDTMKVKRAHAAPRLREQRGE